MLSVLVTINGRWRFGFQVNLFYLDKLRFLGVGSQYVGSHKTVKYLNFGYCERVKTNVQTEQMSK